LVTPVVHNYDVSSAQVVGSAYVLLTKTTSTLLVLGADGRADIKDLLKCQKHVLKVSTASSCSSAKLTSHFIKPQTEEENKIIVAELTQAYHTIKHHQSFRSANVL
jgi:hypothetical protein